LAGSGRGRVRLGERDEGEKKNQRSAAEHLDGRRATRF
jgi:hypothetical protein